MQALRLVVVTLCATTQLAGDACPIAARHHLDLTISVNVLGSIALLQVPCMQVWWHRHSYIQQRQSLVRFAAGEWWVQLTWNHFADLPPRIYVGWLADTKSDNILSAIYVQPVCADSDAGNVKCILAAAEWYWFPSQWLVRWPSQCGCTPEHCQSADRLYTSCLTWLGWQHVFLNGLMMPGCPNPWGSAFQTDVYCLLQCFQNATSVVQFSLFQVMSFFCAPSQPFSLVCLCFSPSCKYILVPVLVLTERYSPVCAEISFCCTHRQSWLFWQVSTMPNSQ